jgi:hypothetical protein
MPDPYPPSELGGKAQRNTIQPPVTPSGMKGHTPTPIEEQRLALNTGQVLDTTLDFDAGEAFHGLLLPEEQAQVAPQPELYREGAEAEG